MAEIASTSSTTDPGVEQTFQDELNEMREIVWGTNIRLDVFQRWSQGLFRLLLDWQIPSTIFVNNNLIGNNLIDMFQNRNILKFVIKFVQNKVSSSARMSRRR